MEIRIIDNQKTTMYDVLSNCIEKSQVIRIAVAFAQNSGFRLIKEALNEFFKSGGKATILIGLDFHTTDPIVLRELLSYREAGYYLDFYCMHGKQKELLVYHPKLYLFNHGDNVVSIIGSSNLSKGGLLDNVELNVEISMKDTEEIYSDLTESYLKMKFMENRFKPTHEYIDCYEDLHKKVRKGKSIINQPLYQKFKQIEESLEKPKLVELDLSGWMRLVYDNIPDEIFTNNDVYKLEEIFRSVYPENKNIKAKIRQQLQFLRNVGLLEHLSRNRWKKKILILDK